MSRAAFDINTAFILALATEARACTDLARLRVIHDAAEEARADADRAVDIVYRDEGVSAGRVCVLILKTDVRLHLMLIRARLRYIELEAQMPAKLA